MAKASTDFKPITFEKVINGKKYTRVAENASDEVKYRFDGWRQVKNAKTSTSTAGGSNKPDSSS